MINTINKPSITFPAYSWAGRVARPARKHLFNPICALFFLLMLFGATAQAARICVPSSFDGSCNSSQATIAAAITAATSGVDDIYVQAGTYSENINYGAKNITILSAAGAATTTIQGTGANAAVVTFNNAAITSAAVLDGFTINNQAKSSATRGIAISVGASPTIKNSIIQDNFADNGTDGGGGVYIVDSSPFFDNVDIKANGALNRNGCGIYIKGAASGASIVNSRIGGPLPADGNSGCSIGAGIYYTGSTTGTLSISGSQISNNAAGNQGGGIWATGTGGTLSISGTSPTMALKSWRVNASLAARD